MNHEIVVSVANVVYAQTGKSLGATVGICLIRVILFRLQKKLNFFENAN